MIHVTYMAIDSDVFTVIGMTSDLSFRYQEQIKPRIPSPRQVSKSRRINGLGRTHEVQPGACTTALRYKKAVFTSPTMTLF